MTFLNGQTRAVGEIEALAPQRHFDSLFVSLLYTQTLSHVLERACDTTDAWREDLTPILSLLLYYVTAIVKMMQATGSTQLKLMESLASLRHEEKINSRSATALFGSSSAEMSVSIFVPVQPKTQSVCIQMTKNATTYTDVSVPPERSVPTACEFQHREA